MPKKSAIEELDEYLSYGGFGRVEREFVFHPTRKWRADFHLPDQTPEVLVEYDGFMTPGKNASHASIGGILRDSEKINAATALGYRVFRANAKSVSDGTFFTLMDTVLVTVTAASEEKQTA